MKKNRSAEWFAVRKKCDSDFEADVYSTCEFIKNNCYTDPRAGRGLEYIEVHHYKTDRVYEIWRPDCRSGPDSGIQELVKRYYIELKAAFNDKHDSLKYPWIKKALQHYEELVFLLQDPNIKKFGCKKLTMARWCEKEGFRWFTKDTIHQLLEKK